MNVSKDVSDGLIRLDKARGRLAVVWYSSCAVVILVLIAQSIGGAYGSDVQRVWGWALPNFLPTLALMSSVIAADALKSSPKVEIYVRGNFCTLAVGLSIFYLVALSIPILLQPFLGLIVGQPSDITARVELLEMSNLWLGPLQGLVVASIGVLFFLKEGEENTPH